MPNGTATTSRHHPLLPRILTMLALPALLLLASCNRTNPNQPINGTPTGGQSMITAPIPIESVDILVAESNPPQVSVKVTGYIPDSCTKAREPKVSRNGSTFTISIIGERPEGVACAQIVRPYEKTIPLGTLDQGRYTVNVNGVSKQFTVS